MFHLFRNKFFVSCTHFREGAAGGGGVKHNYHLFHAFLFCTLLKLSVRSGRIMWDLHVGRMDRQAYFLFPLSPGETRLAFCAGSICMLNGNGCALKATRSLFICCGLVCFWFRPGTRRELGFTALTLFFFRSFLETGCPHS